MTIKERSEKSYIEQVDLSSYYPESLKDILWEFSHRIYNQYQEERKIKPVTFDTPLQRQLYIDIALYNLFHLNFEILSHPQKDIYIIKAGGFELEVIEQRNFGRGFYDIVRLENLTINDKRYNNIDFPKEVVRILEKY